MHLIVSENWLTEKSTEGQRSKRIEGEKMGLKGGHCLQVAEVDILLPSEAKEQGDGPRRDGRREVEGPKGDDTLELHERESGPFHTCRLLMMDTLSLINIHQVRTQNRHIHTESRREE